jgi:hypothetical protein
MIANELTGGHGCCCCGTDSSPGAGPTPETAQPVVSMPSSILIRLDGLPGSSSSPSSSESSSLFVMGLHKAGIGLLRARISFRMRILTPWSVREHDKGVDSLFKKEVNEKKRERDGINSLPSMPGNFFTV